MIGVSTALLVPLTVVVGEEDLLVARAVSAVVRAARELDPEVDVRDVGAGELQRGDLSDVLSPSLFGERRVLVVRSAQDLAKDVAAELTAYLADPLDDVHVVVTHAGGAKGKALLTALLAARPRRVDAPKVTKPAERRDFVRRELKADGRVVEEEAVAALLEAVGTDLRELASAAGQLLADHDGPITTEVVARYHRGRAESSGLHRRRPGCRRRPQRRARAGPLGPEHRPRTGARHERPRQHAALDGAGRQRRPGARRTSSPGSSACRRGRSRRPSGRPAAGAPRGCPTRCSRSPAPTPTSRARRPTRRTPWSGCCYAVVQARSAGR